MALRVLDVERPDDRLRLMTVRTSAVPGEELRVQVLLPRGWSPRAARTWPLLTLHHGGLDDCTSWTRRTDVARLSRDEDVLVVMPDGGRAGGYTDWRRGPQWQRFHIREVFALMRDWYHAAPVRAVAGVSGGGYGALLSAALAPGEFRAVAALSAPCSIRTPVTAVGLLAATGIAGRVNPLNMWGVPVVQDRHWRASDPLHLAPRLRGTRLHLSAGLTGRRGPLDPPDEPWSPANVAEPIVRSTVRPFLRRLRAHGIPYTAHLYRDGTHSWPYWERELHRAWPMLMRSLR
ncbi:alpha/beta hydrolase [Actinomadura atramentaria]|uniref:alpha/beta hydrolase n=1 Tax=Actinomadura atramentaria TaxID=1990 RepID=UPI00035D33DC|nr:alpha/beta hydrolase family protein [Actinomadura atramentaria]